MPFKSNAQRKWMFVHHPKMAKRWAKHTDESDSAEGFEVGEIRHDMDPLGMREMPHMAADMDMHGKHVTVVDLQVEKYPLSREEKSRLFRAFAKSGFVGELDGEFFHFKPDYTIDVVDQVAARKLARLPVGWDKLMVTEAHMGNKYIPDEEDTMLSHKAVCGDDEVPKMTNVFLTKR